MLIYDRGLIIEIHIEIEISLTTTATFYPFVIQVLVYRNVGLLFMNIYQATNLYLNMKIKSPNFSRLSLGLNSEVATLSQISRTSTNINV
jgi:hypothetical protein